MTPIVVRPARAVDADASASSPPLTPPARSPARSDRRRRRHDRNRDVARHRRRHRRPVPAGSHLVDLLRTAAHPEPARRRRLAFTLRAVRA